MKVIGNTDRFCGEGVIPELFYRGSIGVGEFDDCGFRVQGVFFTLPLQSPGLLISSRLHRKDLAARPLARIGKGTCAGASIWIF